MSPEKKRAFLESEIAQQRRWIREHGRDLAGYVERYGAKEDPDHFGDGGEAIFAADSGHLAKLEEQLAALPPAAKPRAFQVLMLVRAAAEIEAKDQADAERRAELLAVQGGSFPLMLIDGAPLAQYYTAHADGIDVADVEEVEPE